MSIEIEDAHVQAIMNRYGVRTKTEAVELASMFRDLGLRPAHELARGLCL